VFVITCAVAVGIATTNIGTLSRYRVPLMPLYVLLVAVLGYRRSASSKPSARSRPEPMKTQSA
jgi:hypothetical protein